MLSRLAVGLATAVFTLMLMQFIEAQERRQQIDLCMPDERMRERVRTIMLDGIDTGLKEQITHLFEVWMKDAKDQPNRATVGARNAIQAYIGAYRDAIDWDPAICR